MKPPVTVDAMLAMGITMCAVMFVVVVALSNPALAVVMPAVKGNLTTNKRYPLEQQLMRDPPATVAATNVAVDAEMDVAMGVVMIVAVVAVEDTVVNAVTVAAMAALEGTVVDAALVVVMVAVIDSAMIALMAAAMHPALMQLYSSSASYSSSPAIPISPYSSHTHPHT